MAKQLCKRHYMEGRAMSLVNPPEGAIPVQMVAEFYGIDRSAFRRWLIKNGIKPVKCMGYDRRQALQPMIVLSKGDLERVGALRGDTMVVEDLLWSDERLCKKHSDKFIGKACVI